MKRVSGKIAEKSFASDLKLLPEIQEFVKQTIANHLSHEKIDAVTLAVSEAVSNGIKHGNKSDISKKVVVKIFSEKDKIKISVRDEGSGFDLSKIPDPTNPENLLKESGRGIFIIKNVIDKLEYNFLPEGTETILTINK